jgi:hypothetical protein
VIILFSTSLYRHFNLGNLERFGINEDENEEAPRLSRGVDHFCPIDVVLGYS